MATMCTVPVMLALADAVAEIFYSVVVSVSYKLLVQGKPSSR